MQFFNLKNVAWRTFPYYILLKGKNPIHFFIFILDSLGKPQKNGKMQTKR